MHYHGYENKNDTTYFEFFNMEEYPDKFRDYIKMQEGGLVIAFNMEVDEHYNSVVENIDYMVKNSNDYDYGDQCVINEYFLKIKYPEYLEEIGYDGKFDDLKKIRMKVDEILYA